MIINDVNSLMRWTFGRLPSEYQEVEYVESHKQEYINTGYLPQNTTGVDIGFLATFTGGTANAYGVIFGDNETDYILQVNWGGKLNDVQVVCHVKASTTNTNFNNAYTNTSAKNVLKLYRNSGTFAGNWTWELNGNKMNKSGRSTNDATCPIILFGGYHATADPPGAYPHVKYDNLKIYHFKLYDETTYQQYDYVRDLVPCYRKSDGVIGMYDLCESICPLTNSPFYINASGNGAFTKGADV